MPTRHAVVARSEAARSEAARSDATQQALSELAGTLTSLHALGLRADCLAWVVGCETADASRLSDLLALGHATGTSVVLSATGPEIAAELAAGAGVVVASGPITGSLAERLADLAVGNGAIAEPAIAQRVFADSLQRQRRGSATMIADGAIAGQGSFLTVPIGVTEVR
ncbi:MAG TPA: hypothetical protein VGI64_06075 [Streptosporangiaceae bacterium]